ncbi:hypothetical protein AAVH_17190, partial [Aphelenchoides avenae]
WVPRYHRYYARYYGDDGYNPQYTFNNYGGGTKYNIYGGQNQYPDYGIYPRFQFSGGSHYWDWRN